MLKDWLSLVESMSVSPLNLYTSKQNDGFVMLKNTALVKKIIHNQKSTVCNPQKDTSEIYIQTSTTAARCLVHLLSEHTLNRAPNLPVQALDLHLDQPQTQIQTHQAQLLPYHLHPTKKFHHNTNMLYIRWIHTHHIKSITFSVQYPMHVTSTSEIINTGLRQQYWNGSYLQLHDCISTI